MQWWQWSIAAGVLVFIGWGIAFWVLERRAGDHRSHYSDGCVKPIIEKATREDGSFKNIFPRPGDGEVSDLEHLLSHKDAT
jgi:hypothetical protein